MIEYEKSLAQLEINKSIIENLMLNLTEEQVRWKPSESRWSILEILNHIIDIEIEDFRYNFDLILFKPEKEWPSFDEIKWITSRKYNERELSSSIEKFKHERNHSINWLQELSSPDLFSKHLSNKMRLGDLLSSWLGHDLFHIKHITLMKWDILEKWSDPFSPEYSGFYV